MLTASRTRFPLDTEDDTIKISPRTVNIKAKRAARRARKLKNKQARHMRKVA